VAEPSKTSTIDAWIVNRSRSLDSRPPLDDERRADPRGQLRTTNAEATVMVEINRDPHEYGYAFIPLNRVTALFSSSEDARASVKELHALGFGPETLDVFVGEQGAAALDLSGEDHGTVTRILRNFEALMVQMAGDSHKRAHAALNMGGVAVAVLMDGKEKMKEDVASVLKRHRAEAIRYWSRWTIESMD